MKLEQQVCSLELAKRLKELRVRQQSSFYWMKLKQNKKWTIEFHTNNSSFDHLSYEDWVEINDKGYSAFTVAELGKLLPWTLPYNKDGNFKMYLICHEDSVMYQTSVGDTIVMEDIGEFYFYAETEADARAKMLVYLLENNLITL